MGVIQYPTPIPTTVGVKPNLRFMTTTDNLSTITTAGYLNGVNADTASPLSNNDIILALYSYNVNTNAGSFAILTVSISTATGSITLSNWGDSGGVVLPTIANHIATYTNTSGTLSEDAATAINGGNLQAGLSGTAGTVASFPGTASKGSLLLKAVANTGNTNTTISNAAMGQASVISIPDPAAATADFVVAPAALVNGNLVQASGTAGLVADSGIVGSNVVTTTGVFQMQPGSLLSLNKANGTESGNAVTANGQGGTITTSSLTTAGGGSYVINFTNSYITSVGESSAFLVSLAGGTNTTKNITIQGAIGGSTNGTITIYNNTAATALNGTILINYIVM
jgi:hypothetical protein